MNVVLARAERDGAIARTSPGTGRGTRAAIRSAFRTAIGDPGLWLIGGLSFVVRGGVLVVLLPILWVPSPVLMSVYLAPFITTSGISKDAVPAALALVVAVIVALVAAVALAAYAQLASFERIVTAGTTAALRSDRQARTIPNRERAGIVLRLAVLQLAGLVPVVALLPTIGQHIGDAGLAELQLPTSTDTPLVIAILERVQNDLVLLAVVVLVSDLVVALLGHQFLAARFGLAPRDPQKPRESDARALVRGAARIVRQPFRTLFLFVVAWLVTISAVAITVATTMLAWDTIRQFLFGPPQPTSLDATIVVVGQVIAVVLFAAIWVAGITLLGFASSLRGALWTTNALH